MGRNRQFNEGVESLGSVDVHPILKTCKNDETCTHGSWSLKFWTSLNLPNPSNLLLSPLTTDARQHTVKHGQFAKAVLTTKLPNRPVVHADFEAATLNDVPTYTPPGG